MPDEGNGRGRGRRDESGLPALGGTQMVPAPSLDGQPRD